MLGNSWQQVELLQMRLTRGNVLVHGLWKNGSTYILNIRITDTDSKSYSASSSSNVLEKVTKEKKDKYMEAWLKRRQVVYSFGLLGGWDGVQGDEGLREVRGVVTCKQARPFAQGDGGFVRSRMPLAIIWSNTLLLHGARRGGANRLETDWGCGAYCDGEE
ncbi:LOW QUALITY PROTEIN: hypothetical protein ACHAXR_002530 [Thalassiosira sp. AJA248-18]